MRRLLSLPGDRNVLITPDGKALIYIIEEDSSDPSESTTVAVVILLGLCLVLPAAAVAR